MHIAWDAVQLVVAIAEGGSLSAAARVLRTTQPTVSRRLAELEAQLGEPLFARAVGGTTPTSFGERVLGPARRMAEYAAEVDHAAEANDAGPRGVVRISAAPGVAYAFVAPVAAVLRAELPDVQLEVVSTVRYVDLVRREADLAIRWQSPARRDAQRDLAVLCAVEHPVAAFATPGYLVTRPRGFGIADLDWIAWCAPFDQQAPNPQLAARIPGFRPVFGADDFIVQLRAAEAGIGAIVLTRMRHRLEPASPLVEAKLDLAAPPALTHLVAARASLAVPRIAAVAEVLARELASTVRGPSRRRPSPRPAR
jgi:DNA-binding transcriptional LysR family regulator